MAQWVKNLTSIHEGCGFDPWPLSGLRIWCCSELRCRRAAVAPIPLLAWDPPYAAGVALKRKKKKFFF